ncbi:MAG: lipopolysaccharide biosynthesis protein [Treponema sp.]|nr:lipopolysaccharide biosynthesis protein [Treponema sp.]
MNEEIEKKENESDDEISLIDLFAVVWRYKIMILVVTVLAGIGVNIFSYVSDNMPPEKSFYPNLYTPQALMLIENRSSGGSISSALGGLASLAGISMSSGSSFSELALYLINTNSFLDSVVDQFDLIKKYNLSKSPKTTSRNIIRGPLTPSYDQKSGVLSIGFTHRDPVFARDIVNFCTTYLERRFIELGLDKNLIERDNLEFNIDNTFQEIIQLEEESRSLELTVATASPYGRLPAITSDINRITLELTAKRQIYTQLRVQYELLKISMASETPIFQILEMAEIPDKESKPNREMLCIIVTLAGFFVSVFLAFVINAIVNIRKDPKAMAKLRGINEE